MKNFMTPKTVTIAVVVGLLVIFTMQNSEVLQINFLFWSFQTRRVALIVVVLIGGVLIGRLTAGWPRPKDNQESPKTPPSD
jgi:uncharacterized integral membrane protein